MAGCTTPLKFEVELTPDRPQVTTVSRAMALARLIETTDNCRGCADAPLWANERDLEGKVGFDPIVVQEEIRDAIREARREGKLPPVNTQKNESSFELTDALMVSDSLDGRWTTSPDPGVMLGVTALFWLFSDNSQRKPEDVKYGPATDYFKALADGELDVFRSLLTSFLASTPYSMRRKSDEPERERYFQDTFYLLLRLMSVYAVFVEKAQSEGRVDCIVETPKNIYIFEFKLDGSTQQALQQIKDKGYARPYEADGRTVYLVGVNFSSETGTISDWEHTVFI